MTALTLVLIFGVTVALAGTFFALASMVVRLRHPREHHVPGFSERTLSALRR